MLLWLALVSAAQPGPVAPGTGTATTWPTDLDGLVGALSSDAMARRGYAARELRRRAYRTARALTHPGRDPERALEAKVELADPRRLAVPACVAGLTRHASLARPCLAVVGAVGTRQVASALRAARPELAPRHHRRLDATITALEGSP